MIDTSALNANPAPGSAEQPSARPRLHMRRDPDARMAGSIPVWENSKSAVEQPANFKTAMNYADMEPAAGNATDISGAEEESFGFGDLIDIVNPLHHIPLVSTVYESITGDTIRPSGQIIGGAIYGGFIGAAAGVANLILEEETGKDISGNVVALVTQGELPKMRHETLSPEENLNQAARVAFNDIETEALPAMALGIAPDTHLARTRESRPHIQYEYYNDDDDRMAGATMRPPSYASEKTYSPLPRTTLADPASINLAAIRAEEVTPVTDIKISPLP